MSGQKVKPFFTKKLCINRIVGDDLVLKRVSVFIDGFNLYHSLTQEVSPHRYPYKKYKWLDLHALASMFLRRDEAISSLHYFTAFVPWDPGMSARHHVYVEAQKRNPIQLHLGSFRKKWKTCRAACKQQFETYEEKMTDVNIAVELILSCVQNHHDVAFLISGDNDMMPALEAAQKLCPQKELRIILPVSAKSKRMTQWATAHKIPYAQIKENHLRSAQLPTDVAINGTIFSKPALW